MATAALDAAAQSLVRLEEVLGRKIVEELEFKIAVPKMKPTRAEVMVSSEQGSGDEADAIRDPIFRSVYKAARKRANA